MDVCVFNNPVTEEPLSTHGRGWGLLGLLVPRQRSPLSSQGIMELQSPPARQGWPLGGEGLLSAAGRLQNKGQTPWLRPAPPPTRRQQMPARCSSRGTALASGLDRPPRPSQLQLPSARHRGVMYARCPSPSAAARSHQRVTAGNNRPVSPVRPLRRAAPVRLRLPHWILQPARSGQTIEHPLGPKRCRVQFPSIHSRSDQPWLCQRSSQHQVFQCF